MENSINNIVNKLIKKYIHENEKTETIYEWYNTRKAIKINSRLLIKIYLDEFKCEEAYSMIYAKKVIGVECPNIISHGRIGEFVYLIMEFIEGVNLGDIWDELDEDKRKKVRKSIDIEIQKMKNFSNNFIGNFELDDKLKIIKKYISDGNIYETLDFPEISPCLNNIEEWFEFIKERPPNYNEMDYIFVFSHNDLGPWNVIVDPESLELKGIIDWEYSGFYPEYYERSKKMKVNLVRN